MDAPSVPAPGFDVEPGLVLGHGEVRNPELGRQGMTTHCPETPVWRRLVAGPIGQVVPPIENCDERTDGLIDVRRVTGR